eukprot:7153347-Pyramimonas_sp.AAC.1
MWVKGRARRQGATEPLVFSALFMGPTARQVALGAFALLTGPSVLRALGAQGGRGARGALPSRPARRRLFAA